MTENSLGRLWLDGHPNFNHTNWKYYLEEAEQEPDVIEQLNKIKEEHAKLKPEDIKVIDPCMGSGHILVYAFDVLMDIYRDAGYSDRDAAKSILENNLYGLEIDERAYHLAYFALMMKARQYNRRILRKDTKFNLVEIREPINTLKPEFEQYLDNYVDLAHYLVNIFQDAKELGSILNLDCTLEQLNNLKSHLDQLNETSIEKDLVAQSYISELTDLLKPLIKQAKLLVQKHDVVITNPPYMAPSAKQKSYVQKNYPDSKSDLFAIFIEKCHSLTKKNAYQAMITMHSWMFLSSFEKLRNKLLINNTIINMAHLGARAFEDIGGEVVQTTAFVFDNANIKNLQSNFKRLVDYNSQDAKEEEYLKDENLYTSSATNFSKIPGSPIAYWPNINIIEKFTYNKIEDYINCKSGIMTGSDDYIRLWFEPQISKIKTTCKTYLDMGEFKWFPLNSGGGFRKWYGNNSKVVDLYHDGYNIKNNVKNYRLRDKNYYFRMGITWGRITSSDIAFRDVVSGSLFGDAGPIGFVEEHKDYILSFFNTCVTKYLLKILNPTLNFQVHDIMSLPMIISKNEIEVENICQVNIEISKQDWDSFETSWDFKVHPLVELISAGASAWGDNTPSARISSAYKAWSMACDDRFNQLKDNEEELNRIFIDIYGLQDELTPEVEDKDVTVRKADLVRDIKSFISYAVGCMFGRYSLDVEGLAYAGGEWDGSKYTTFVPDKDDIIPICDEEYFEDDIVSRFIEFVSVVYGSDTLEENLKFIADALGGKGTPREVLRNYFLNDFFKDHCNTYQVTGSGKRPIYWLFDSGKKNGFKALVYIHRYTPDLIARMRTGYIHPQQARYRTQIELLQEQIDMAGSTSEKVKLSKQLKKINEQLLELNKYEEIVHHWADKMEPMDLDDGVKANYAKFQELLAKIK